MIQKSIQNVKYLYMKEKYLYIGNGCIVEEYCLKTVRNERAKKELLDEHKVEKPACSKETSFGYAYN